MSRLRDRHFLRASLFNASLSNDPNTRVGAILVGPNGDTFSDGCNHFPAGIAETPERLTHRDMKLRLIVHAEMDAILAAARHGIPTKGSTLYLAATDDSGLVWGGPPCSQCLKHCIQAGIAEVVSHPWKAVPSRWHEDIAFSRTLLSEAGIVYREIAL